MNTDFGSLLRLLRSLEGEVQGRHSSRPPADVERLIQDLIEGHLAPEQKARVCEILRSEPGWIAWVAEQIKNRRNAATDE